MSIEKTAARGVVWNIATGVGARIVGLVGTLVLTRFIAPAEYGEVSAALICIQTASVLSFFAFGQYIIAYKAKPDVVFQGAVLHFLLGAVAMAVVYVLRGPLGVMVEAPEMGRFIGGFAIAHMIDRARGMPERILVRDLRFRDVAIINSIGEVTFTAVALATAPRWGGYAIVIGGLVRSTLTCTLFMRKVPRHEWLVPARFGWKDVRGMFAYGAPLLFVSLCDRAASSWDNVLMLRMFGASLMGCYALSYSLAETPVTYVAERMGDVLMPAFSKMEPEERPAAVLRAAALMSLVVAPLGVGLGAVAPTLVHAFFDKRWAEMGSILAVLSCMTIFQPASWPSIAYLQTERKPRFILIASIARTVSLLSGVALLGRLGGPTWACVGVGLGFTVHTVSIVWLTALVTPLDVGRYFFAVMRPLLACAPMFFGVVAVRRVLLPLHLPAGVQLAVEVLVGAIVYIAGTFLFAGANVRELIGLVRGRRSTSA
jgi:lipopolysaccharide exporter